MLQLETVKHTSWCSAARFHHPVWPKLQGASHCAKTGLKNQSENRRTHFPEPLFSASSVESPNPYCKEHIHVRACKKALATWISLGDARAKLTAHGKSSAWSFMTQLRLNQFLSTWSMVLQNPVLERSSAWAGIERSCLPESTRRSSRNSD